MDKMFSADFFRGNRSKLRQAAETDAPIVMTANGLLQRAGDNTFTFQQDSNFWYLTGVSEPDIELVLEGGSEYLIVPGRSASREAFDGAVTAEALTQTSGIATILDETAGWKRLGKAIRQHRCAAVPLASPAYLRQYGMYTNPARRRLIARLHAYRADLQLIDIRQQLTELRMLKQPEELAALQRAIDITLDSLALLSQPDRLGTYAYEYEIEADLTREFRHKGANGHAFAPIIASGKRGCTLHNVANNGVLKRGELIVLDVGAEVSHYAADITRTVALHGFSRRQQQIHQAVADVQQFALGLLGPGRLLKDYERQVEQHMGEKLCELGLVKNPDREAIRRYFPHATSHFLGLDVHDAGDYSRPLEPGMVLTCEPGIYVPAESIGIRIEDDVLITDTGSEVLSDRLPRLLS